MRICIVQTAFEGHPSEKASHTWRYLCLRTDNSQYDPLCDPSRYVSPEAHTFEHRFVHKATLKQDIDAMCEEKFDMYLSCLWGGPWDNVAGIDAAEYLDTKGVTVLTNTSSAMRMHYSKNDFYARGRTMGLNVPGNTPSHYPKIVKFGDAMSSLALDYESICDSEDAVTKRVAYLKTQEPDAEIVVQDYISGPEVNAVVIEMGTNIVALEPAEYVFPSNTPSEKAFLTFDNKFHKVGSGEIRTRLVTDEPRRTNIQKAACLAFKVAGMGNGGGWGRTDMRVDSRTGKVYALEVNHFPTVFYPGGMYTSDKVIARTYPGAQAALFDMLVATKLIQMKAIDKSHEGVAGFFDTFSPTYNNMWGAETFSFIREEMMRFDWSGSVLDLACGTGWLGKCIREAGHSARVTGVDISPKMAASEACREYYERPVVIEPMESNIMSAEPNVYEHICCFNGFQFLEPSTFTAVLSRMFMLAEKSVSFETDDLPQEHLDLFKERSGGGLMYNNMETGRRFGTPMGWRKVLERPSKLFHSPHFGGDVHGCFFRFERVGAGHGNGVNGVNGTNGEANGAGTRDWL